MKHFINTLLFIAVTLFLASQATSTYASVATTGNVYPGDASDWTTDTDTTYIGCSNGFGSVTVTDSDDILSGKSYIGYSFGSSGEVTVDGEGSTWTSSEHIYIGFNGGSGTLNILNGSTVSVAGKTCVADLIDYSDNTIGSINFGSSNGGTLTTASIIVSPSQLNGTGMINANGIVSDYDLILDSADDLTQTLTFNSADNGAVTVNLNISGNSVSDLGVNNGSLTIQNAITVSSLRGYVGYFPNSSGIVNVSGNGSTWTSTSLCVGKYGNGMLNISNGGTVSSYSGHIGAKFGSSGQVTVNGNNSTWANSTSLEVCYGTLNITNRGKVSNTICYIRSDGEVTVDGGGSTWTNSDRLFIDGNGTLNITNRGKVSNSSGYIGSSWTSRSTVSVDGSGSTWTNKYDLDVRNGTLDITNGGKVTSKDSEIGQYRTSEITVDGTNSTWTNSNNICLGTCGGGIIRITDGGAVSCNTAYIGFRYAFGNLIVDGNDSKWTSNDIYVGFYKKGMLSITNGGTASNASAYIGTSSGSMGTVTVDGNDSTWTNNDNLHIGSDGSGTLYIKNNGLASVAGTLTIDDKENGDSFINMSDGGMLALFGEGSGSLTAFFDLAEGTDAIQWWDPAVGGWNSLTTATLGKDYTLEHLTSGDLEDYTLLTVLAPANAVPEPSTIVSLLMLLVAGLALTIKKRQ